jgi:glutamyl-tRNA synthetase
MNGYYTRAMSDAELTEILLTTLPYLPQYEGYKSKLNERTRQQLLSAMSGLKERAKTLCELAEGAHFLFATRPLGLDDKAQTILDANSRAHIAQLLPRFESLPEWTAAATEDVVRRYAEETGLKLGQIAQPLRAALTGRATSPGIFDVLVVLGREESLGRLADQA